MNVMEGVQFSFAEKILTKLSRARSFCTSKVKVMFNSKANVHFLKLKLIFQIK